MRLVYTVPSIRVYLNIETLITQATTDTKNNMDNISVGSRVIIPRSDGRIHQAVIDAKNENMQTVTVAWTEDSKLMGKELKWDYIVDYNPNLKYLKPLNKDQLQLVEKIHTNAKIFENFGEN